MADVGAFVQEFGPGALWGAQTYGFSPDVLLGITASESNYGAAPTYFGITCAGYKTCKEYVSQGTDCPGCSVSFRTYGSYQEAIADFADLVQNHYPQAWMNRGGDRAQFLLDLQAGGYTTASEWTPNVLQVANQVAPLLGLVTPSDGPTSRPPASTLNCSGFDPLCWAQGVAKGVGGAASGAASTVTSGLGFLTDPIGYLRKAFVTPFETVGIFIVGAIAVLGGFLIISNKARGATVTIAKESAKAGTEAAVAA